MTRVNEGSHDFSCHQAKQSTLYCSLPCWSKGYCCYDEQGRLYSELLPDSFIHKQNDHRPSVKPQVGIRIALAERRATCRPTRHGTGSYFVTQRPSDPRIQRPGDPVDPVTLFYNELQMSTYV